jgi:hypothetical protein
MDAGVLGFDHLAIGGYYLGRTVASQVKNAAEHAYRRPLTLFTNHTSDSILYARRNAPFARRRVHSISVLRNERIVSRELDKEFV